MTEEKITDLLVELEKNNTNNKKHKKFKFIAFYDFKKLYLIKCKNYLTHVKTLVDDCIN